MNNAFTILGAEPTDTAERLQELLDEKELLLDDISEVQAAYADLTNPKKRIQHEISYFCSDALDDFNKLVNKQYEEAPTLGQIANIVVELGWWFESDDDDLYDKINDARTVSGFTQLDSIDVVTDAVQALKQDCIQAINSYFDRLKEKSLIGIFNQIVKIDEYESFFIYELMAHYELIVKEQLEGKENKVIVIFDEIEKMCNQFNNGAALSPELNGKVDEFRNALKEWDNIAQPLQVDMQQRGGQHESSGQLVHDIRNRIIELCNCSQEKLQKSIESFERTSLNAQLGVGSRYQAISARDMLEKKLNDSISFTKTLIALTDILSQVFAELEITAEQLKKDRSQLVDLRDTLTKLRNQIPGAAQRASYTPTQTSTPTSTYSSQWTNNSSTSSEHNGYRILLGIIAAICGILMIVGFAIGNVAMGIAFIILGLAFGIGCGAFYMLKENKKALLAVVLVPIVLILAVVVPVASCSSDDSNGKVSLSISNFENYFTVSASGPSSGRSATVNYSIAPKKSSYSSNSESTTITVKIKISVRSSRYSTLRKSETVSVTLNKSSGYKKSGSITINLGSSNYSSLYYDTEITSCRGTIVT